MKRMLRWVFGSALTTRDQAIRLLQQENRSFALEIARLKSRGESQ